jgi:hypothetical protein
MISQNALFLLKIIIFFIYFLFKFVLRCKEDVSLWPWYVPLCTPQQVGGAYLCTSPFMTKPFLNFQEKKHKLAELWLKTVFSGSKIDHFLSSNGVIFFFFFNFWFVFCFSRCFLCYVKVYIWETFIFWLL